MIEHDEMRNTVFGEVLCELFESRDLLLTPAAVEEYASACGCEGEAVVNRMASTDEGCGALDGLADDMELTTEEMKDLANAAAYDKRSYYRTPV
jgi:hypothetical protein